LRTVLLTRYIVPIKPGKIKLINHRQVTACKMALSESKLPNNRVVTNTRTPISDMAGTGATLCITYAIGIKAIVYTGNEKLENNCNSKKNCSAKTVYRINASLYNCRVSYGMAISNLFWNSWF